MATAPSFDELIAVAKAELQTARPNLQVNDGDITLAMLHSGGAMADAVLRYAAQAFKETFVDGASGDSLTTLASDHFNITRSTATAATATATFYRTSAAAGTIAAGTTVATDFTADGEVIEFTTNNNLTFGSGTASAATTVTCTITGTDGNVAASTITRIVDVIAFDTSMAVRNDATAGGGNDEETDTELRARIRSYFKTLRRGTLAALEYGAKQVDAVRVAVASEDADGIVTVYVSDSDGNSTAEMINDVDEELLNWRCAGVPVNVSGGSQVVIDLTMTVDQYRTGFSVSASASLIQDAISARIDKLAAGDTLYLDSVIAAAIAAFPEDIYDVTITSIDKDGTPQSLVDVTAAVTEVLRAGTVTVT